MALKSLAKSLNLVWQSYSLTSKKKERAHRGVEHHVLGAVNEAHVAHRLARVPAGLQRAEDQALHAHAVDPQDLSHPMMR